MSKLKGKVAVVTGASKGIGAAIAKALAGEGAAVAVNYASSRKGADQVVAEIEKDGGKAVAIQGDMAKPDDVVRLFAETEQALGNPNVLVNNAGVFQFDPLDQVKPEEFHRQFDINVLGPILAARRPLPISARTAAASSMSALSFRPAPFPIRWSIPPPKARWMR